MPAGPTEFEMESDKEYIHERSVSRCCAKDQIQNIKFEIKLVKLVVEKPKLKIKIALFRKELVQSIAMGAPALRSARESAGAYRKPAA
jgi:hypothetical protein